MQGRNYQLITVLGLAQILAWSSTFYLPAVLARPVSAHTGWSLTAVIAGLSWGFVVTGICAPKAGRFIEKHGGRKALMISSVAFALGLFSMGMAEHIAVYYLAWSILGVGMALGLYDAAFSMLGRLLGNQAKTAIVGVTLFGGLASTIGWYMIAQLEAHYGWQISCFVLAALHLIIGLPLYFYLLPKDEMLHPSNVPPQLEADETAHSTHLQSPQTERYLLILVSFILTVQSFVVATISVHLLNMLKLNGLTVSSALMVGMLIGPAQIVARLLEFSLFKNLHPTWSSRIGVIASLSGIIFLFTQNYGIALLGAALYGAGNGILTIIRGTLPLALFGQDGYATRMGQLGRPIMIALATGPVVSALILENWGLKILLIILIVLVVIAMVGAMCLPTRTRA